MTLPTEYRQRVDDALVLADAAIRPAGPKATTIALDELFDWVETYGVIPLPAEESARKERLTKVVGRLLADLADLPSDLLVKAVREVIKQGSYRVLPMPGDFRKAVSEEVARRNALKRRLETAKRFGQFYPPRAPATPEQLEHASAMAAKAREILAGAVPSMRIDEEKPLMVEPRGGTVEAEVEASHETRI